MKGSKCTRPWFTHPVTGVKKILYSPDNYFYASHVQTLYPEKAECEAKVDALNERHIAKAILAGYDTSSFDIGGR